MECLEWTPYFVMKNKTFTIEFTYTVPLLRSETENYTINITKKNIESKVVNTTLRSSDTVRVYELIKKRNKVEAYIESVRRLDFWW